jgi:hypothetical protein
MPRHRAAAILMTVLTLVMARPSAAETAIFDFKLHPGLAAEFAKGEQARVLTDNQAPRFILTRFIVDGESGEDWIETFEILDTMRRNEPRTPQRWYGKFQKAADPACKGDWKLLSETEDSLTFERITPACGPHEAQAALYRVLYGRNEVFTLIATRKGGMHAETADAWVKVLASASIRD